MNTAIDWEETKTDQLLAQAKKTGYFLDVIRDAKYFEADGYRWDVALAKALEYWR
jgi:hypothetical protein